jgi:hypothetical protein
MTRFFQSTGRASLAGPLYQALRAGGLTALLAGCGGSDGTPMCQASATPQAAAAFCAPARIAAGQQLTLQIQEQCGGCTQKADHCDVQVSGQSIKLGLLGQTCTLSPSYACPAICSVNTFTCTVPPLAAGTYQVSTEAGTAMVVSMIADPMISATACTVPFP